MLGRRRGLGLCQLGGPLYAIGGMDDTSFFNTVERYDSLSDSWTTVAPMKSPRGGVAVAVLKVSVVLAPGHALELRISYLRHSTCGVKPALNIAFFQYNALRWKIKHQVQVKLKTKIQCRSTL